MQINGDVVSPVEFPNWHYAEVSIGKMRQVCAVFHCQTPIGSIPYWYDDPDHQERALPLTKAIRPIVLGDYGSVLARGRNMSIFVGLCKAIDDLPDPLITVQVIHWIERRLNPAEDLSRFAIRQALHAVQLYHEQRRREFDYVLEMLCGAATQ